VEAVGIVGKIHEMIPVVNLDFQQVEHNEPEPSVPRCPVASDNFTEAAGNPSAWSREMPSVRGEAATEKVSFFASGVVGVKGAVEDGSAADPRDCEAGAVACWAQALPVKKETNAKGKQRTGGRWEKFSRMVQSGFRRILTDCMLFVNWRRIKTVG
jgi:hypothetical protein